jgi:hypothetical protein
MTQIQLSDPACDQVRSRLDAYLDAELLSAANLEMQEHLERCPACREEAEARSRARRRLRTAVRSIEIPAGMEDRIRRSLRPSRTAFPWRVNMMAMAAALAISIGAWLARLEVDSAPPMSRAESILRVGLGDHIHCAVARKSHQLLTADGTWGANLPHGFSGLAPLVRQYIPKEFAMVMAHECSFRSRKFVHLTFQSGVKLASLVIARKEDGESLRASGLPRVLIESGIPMYAAGVEQYRIAAFESRDHLIYTVSEMPQDRNVQWMAALMPSLQQFLKQMEG